MRSLKKHCDAVVVGSGPNGMACAIALRHAGLSVVVIEQASQTGGAAKTEELTLPGFYHDVYSAVHPFAAASPFFKSLPLENHGLKWVHSPAVLAHPFENGEVALLRRGVAETANDLDADSKSYVETFQPIVDNFDCLVDDMLKPIFHWPKHPLKLSRFGLQTLRSAQSFAFRTFQSEKARALYIGIAAHSPQRLNKRFSSAIGVSLQAAGHAVGWPIPKGGAGQLSEALVSYFISIGGEIETDFLVEGLDQLPSRSAVFFDLTPRQIDKITGVKLPRLKRAAFKKYPLGCGVFKMDWALNAPIPWKNPNCSLAATLHIGGSADEILESEFKAKNGEFVDRPYIILSQPTLFDPSRAPRGQHIAWGYCHVPNGSKTNMTEIVENQIERFAPGFRQTILKRNALLPRDLETRNPNLIGGDIFGGDPEQIFFRPTVSINPYRLDDGRLWICSSSTPPGPAVHGMCGFNAARAALRSMQIVSK